MVIERAAFLENFAAGVGSLMNRKLMGFSTWHARVHGSGGEDPMAKAAGYFPTATSRAAGAWHTSGRDCGKARRDAAAWATR